MKKIDWTWVSIMFGVSLFLGYVLFTAGAASIFPKIHMISKPIVCSGEFEIKTTQYSYKPGQVGWQHNIYCDSREITFPTIGVTGLLFSLAIFAVIMVRTRKNIFLPENFGELANDLKRTKKDRGRSTTTSGSALERLTQLKKMRDQNLISDVEYERKKDEIMKDL